MSRQISSVIGGKEAEAAGTPYTSVNPARLDEVVAEVRLADAATFATACRTAAEGQAVAVLCLAFPVHPPGRPEKSRLSELAEVDVPVLVVQGERDPFGMPPAAHHREVVVVPGDHSLKADPDLVGRTAGEWLSRILRPLD